MTKPDRRRRNHAAGALLSAGALALLVGLAWAGTAPARADERHWEGDIHHFHEHDLARWRGGHWYHGNHGGRPGWWWIVGGVWYYYPAAVYPYPDPYAPPPPPPPLAPGVPAAPPPPPPAQYYYCDNPPGYYPYIPACRMPWRAVPSR